MLPQSLSCTASLTCSRGAQAEAAAAGKAAAAVDKELLEMLEELDVKELANALAAASLTSVRRLQRMLEKLTAVELAEKLKLTVYEKEQLIDLCAKLQPVRHPASGWDERLACAERAAVCDDEGSPHSWH